jgi:hypothetical protein
MIKRNMIILILIEKICIFKLLSLPMAVIPLHGVQCHMMQLFTIFYMHAFIKPTYFIFPLFINHFHKSGVYIILKCISCELYA